MLQRSEARWLFPRCFFSGAPESILRRNIV
jgi:hypothetical protein